jgi:hypothetical protein
MMMVVVVVVVVVMINIATIVSKFCVEHDHHSLQVFQHNQWLKLLFPFNYCLW